MSRRSAARRSWTPERRAAHVAQMRAEIAAGFRRLANNPRLWTSTEDALLRSLAGTLPLVALVEAFNARSTGPYRSLRAIQKRLVRLGESQMVAALSATQVHRRLGVRMQSVLDWLHDGLLRGTPSRPDRRSPWLVTEADLVAFVRAYPHLLAAADVRDRRLRAELDTALRADPLLNLDAACRLLGLSESAVLYWTRRGALPCVRGHRRTWIRRRDLIAFMATRQRRTA